MDAQVYNDLGQLKASQDARFFAEGKGTLNFQYTRALSGQMLQTVSVDAGTSQEFADIRRPLCGRGILEQKANMMSTTYLEIPIDADLHEKLRRATELQRGSMTDFIIFALRDAAQHVLEQGEIVNLTLADQQCVAQALWCSRRNPMRR
ncbi:DUF1778 domain-containing protein [Achromobacter sp. K91]|uniref:type II toxin-antitoxin system TacA family antitoxin n=1 Tax=Achromobacter sp. K91 TaxID=2292262 RepID=UPI001F350B78|nr:DUF1778 domain-containing protein [Achromobacter sp. K91]